MMSENVSTQKPPTSCAESIEIQAALRHMTRTFRARHTHAPLNTSWCSGGLVIVAHQCKAIGIFTGSTSNASRVRVHHLSVVWRTVAVAFHRPFLHIPEAQHALVEVLRLEGTANERHILVDHRIGTVLCRKRCTREAVGDQLEMRLRTVTL